MADLFKEVIPSILMSKNAVINEDNERDYVPFVVNRMLSYHYDCILAANEMNVAHELDNLLQFHFYLNTIRAKKRPYKKWLKPEVIDDLEYIKQYFGYSNEKAKDALQLLSRDQVDTIKKEFEEGGLNAKSRRTGVGQA